ncbi:MULTISPECIES: PTS system mannose/fructose/N-acetylgalactosamine-transporter subunit IIB [Lactiplantibacillus]|jgi:PTS system fructose-specific IIB component|uniref:PTS fructose transporter subunit IIB n=1 Tax=Lactiplantibacillus pentosus TaxID=1589 RepID=A0A2K9I3U5_LACPE|nr:MULTISPECIES: PTS sugar transporter subunit IIB [Lactiplantibacillus]BBM21108.1 PTS system, mannose-specific EIIB component [Lactiplantibacillus plantarum]AUI79676.1 PTS fructose transporter subunit IIB [Lactiplantibacillus pentosus]AYG36451.1 PTS fructose transporter subunit IIB [Lactiplantibacillus pentosus]AYG42079.1 PTS fructose transporter subunit IIB [Lactiplantibacillus pentosus]MBO9166248.1 PTS sugar transporter subunit IIB [Lactiplantibacillus pentosus]
MTMDIRLARIDSRLLHGQVATVWTKSVSPNRILVVSDEVARDALRKILIVQAAPPGVKANVITVDKMIEIYHDSLFDNVKPLILTDTPQNMARLVAGGLDFSQTGVDIGSLAFSTGMVMVTNAVAVGQAEADALYALAAAGLKVYAQKVPTDKQVDLMPLLAKNGFAAPGQPETELK